MAAVFITHDMGVMAEVADCILVMYKGDRAGEGSSVMAFAQPTYPYTHVLLSAVPRLGSTQGTDGPAHFPLLWVDGTATAVDMMPQPAASRDVQPVLRVRDLVTRLDVPTGILDRVMRRVHAVEQVSFDLYPGETLALVDESGCGKSTTGWSLLCLVDSQSGGIELVDQNIGELKGPALQTLRRNIQFIFQDPFAPLDPRVSVGYSIMESLPVHKVASDKETQQRVEWLLDKVGLQAAHTSRYLHEFPGGWCQRTCTARALALNPRAVTADESASTLDVSIQAQIVNLMLDLQKEFGVAFLFISYGMAVVERISYHVVVMYLGQIVEIGLRHVIFESPQHSYTRRLMSTVLTVDPARRYLKRELSAHEISSPIRAVGDPPVVQPLAQMAPDYFVACHSTGGAY